MAFAGERTSILAGAVALAFVAVVFIAGPCPTGYAAEGRVDYLGEIHKWHTPEPYDPNLDAAPHFEAALAAAVPCPFELQENLREWPGDLSADQRQSLADWVASNEEALAQLKLAVARPYYIPNLAGESLLTADVPNCSKTRSLLFCCSYRAMLKAYRDRCADAVDDLVTCYRMGQMLAGRKPPFLYLSGIAARSRSANALCTILSRTTLDPDTLSRMQNTFEGLSTNDLRLDFTGQRFYYRAVIRELFTQRGRGRLRKGLPADANELSGDFREYWQQFYPRKYTNWDELDGVTTLLLADKTVDYCNSIADKTPAYFHSQAIVPHEQQRSLAQGNPIINMFALPAAKIAELEFRAKIETQALITVLALLRCYDNRTSYPDTLKDLVQAGYIKNVPIDPYSDKPLVYRRTDHGFILYSLGADFDDDGGTASRWGTARDGGDQVFWPVN